MASVRHLITGFMAGEISPELSGRVDTQQYAFGLDTCENFVPINEGPIVKRPGFSFIRDADPTSTWLTPFRFSVTQEYVLEWGAAKLRFFTNGGRVESPPGTPTEVVTPYTAAEAPFVSTQQSFDRLYIDHVAHPPGALSRTSAVTFTYGASAFVNGPFTDQNTDQTNGVLVTGTTAGASITVASALPTFATGHVGSLFRIEALDFSDLKVWEPAMNAVAIGMVVRSDGKAYQAETAGATGTVQPTHETGSEWDGLVKQDVVNLKGPYGVKWKFLYERFGIVQITAFGTATDVTATVIKAMPTSLLTVASWRWAHGAFSNARGWPGLVVHFAGRQCHIKGFELLGSVAGDFLNHQAFTSSGVPTSDLAFRRTLDADNPPIWVAADKAILLGTANREIAVSAINAQSAISGANIKAEPQSFYGSEQITPLQQGTETIFIETGGRRIRSASYDFSRDRYVPTDLTAAARHITKTGVVQLAYQRVPYALLHAVRGDGQIATHAATRDDLKGFSRMVLGGAAQALSAVSIKGIDGKTDELWVLVSRSTPGGTRKEIWKQEKWRELGDDQRNAFYVDGGAQVAAAGGQTHFTGLTHLAGQAVAVLANGAVVPGLTVSGAGVLDLPAIVVPATPYTMTVGLTYTARATLLRPAARTKAGDIQGLRQRVVKMVLRLLESVGLRAGPPGGYMNDLIDRGGDDAMNAPIPLFTGDTQGSEIEMDFDRRGQVTIVSDVPLPAIVTAAMLKMDVDEGDA